MQGETRLFFQQHRSASSPAQSCGRAAAPEDGSYFCLHREDPAICRSGAGPAVGTRCMRPDSSEVLSCRQDWPETHVSQGRRHHSKLRRLSYGFYTGKVCIDAAQACSPGRAIVVLWPSLWNRIGAAHTTEPWRDAPVSAASKRGTELRSCTEGMLQKRDGTRGFPRERSGSSGYTGRSSRSGKPEFYQIR